MDLLRRFASYRSACWPDRGRGKAARLFCACLATLFLGTPVVGEQIPVRGRGILVRGPNAPEPVGQLTAEAIALESLDVGPAMKGAPYSAEATTEIVQPLVDGNRIVRRTSALLYRDSRGRTRREVMLDNIAGIIVSGNPLRTITISDPDAGTTYFIDPDKRVRVVRHRPEAGRSTSATPPQPLAAARQSVPESKTDQASLGTRVIEGLTVEGTRTTLTIPAGAIGNERPITGVSERWFSPELRIVVLSRRTDPRFGETTYRLTKIRRAEPPTALFEVRP